MATHGPERLAELTKGWLELESDPGLFTLLLEDFGVQGVQVEEIYDLQKPIEGPVYGFIFLFKWIEERRSRRKVTTNEEAFVKDASVDTEMFFAQQLIPNSCATHALLSVLLNCKKLHLGETLSKLKAYTYGMCPESKGYAIGNMAELAKAHNSHAKPERSHPPEKHNGISTGRTMEAFHFVSYVPINGRLYELDGLKPYPIDHGPIGENEDWTEKFLEVITERLGIATSGEPYHDIRFNLMAVVPDRRQLLERKLQVLKTNRQIVMEALQQLVKTSHPDIKQPSVKTGKGTSHFTLDSAASIAKISDVVKSCDPEGGASTDDNQSTTSSTVSRRKITVKLPPELDTHNYAKSPIVHEDASDQEVSSDEETAKNVESGPEPQFHVLNTDTGEHPAKKLELTKPLTVQTRFSNVSVSGETTDTASEASSAFSSPAWSRSHSVQTSPRVPRNCDDVEETNKEEKDISKLVVIKVASSTDASSDSIAKSNKQAENVSDSMKSETCEKPIEQGVQESTVASTDNEDKLLEPQASHSAFAPKDLLVLLKSLESEITMCESHLRDEQEKRKKYKIDDCRRTHNYDPFITTFLTMMADHGLLADLVDQHTTIKRRYGLNIGKLNKVKKQEPKKRYRAKKKR